VRDDELDVTDVHQRARTGPVPEDRAIDAAVDSAYRRARDRHDGGRSWPGKSAVGALTR